MLLQWKEEIFFFVVLGLQPQRMEVPRVGIKLELQLLAYAKATKTPDLSRVCDLHHSSQQCQILNPLSETKDRTCILTDTAEPQEELQEEQF